MAVFHFVRHGLVDAPDGLLVGRRPGYHLRRDDLPRVSRLVSSLAAQGVDRIYHSPLERTRETAQILAEGLKLDSLEAPELIEVDFGSWAGRTFRDIEVASPQWESWNTFRSATRCPGGESMLAVQARVVDFVLGLRDAAPAERVVLVTHGDVIRAALLYFLGMPLDHIQRLSIDLASLSSLRIDEHGLHVFRINWNLD